MKRHPHWRCGGSGVGEFHDMEIQARCKEITTDFVEKKTLLLNASLGDWIRRGDNRLSPVCAGCEPTEKNKNTPANESWHR